MKLKWLGHSCFLLESSQGIKIITDPFDASVGYPLPNIAADIVTISHDHYDHNNIGAVKGSFLHISEPGDRICNGIHIQSIPTWHDDCHGEKRGRNLIFLFDIDGVRICHLGDLGHIPTPEQVAALRPVDVLLIPVDGVYTMDAKTAAQAAALFHSKITIPMHYKTKVSKLNLHCVEPFLTCMGGGKRTGSSQLELNPENLPAHPQVLLLEYQ